jgi:2-aminoadipate transaminase
LSQAAALPCATEQHCRKEETELGLPWETLLRESDRRLRSSDIRDLLAVTAQPGVISFAGGLPAPELFPIDDLRAAFDAVLSTDGPGALQYGPTEGYAPLRDYLAHRLARRGIVTKPENILLTTGSQQGLDLLSKVFLHAHSPVLVEAPSYVGALQAFASHGSRCLAVPVDDQGMCVERAALMLYNEASRSAVEPALLYTVATFQNPSGVTMSRERRLALLDLCAVKQLPLVEDDPYGELRYEGEEVLALRALPGGEETIYLGTFSKILAPGLRLGWVVAPQPVIARLVIAKQATDLHTDSLVQRAVLHYCMHADMDGHIAHLRTAYRSRRDAMLAALTDYFPSSVHWTYPKGGLFIWVTLPGKIDTRALLAEALESRVVFVPGTAFFMDNQGSNCLRLNFSHVVPARINEGIQRLAKVVTRHL